MAHEMGENNLHISLVFFKTVLYGRAFGDTSMLAFRDPKTLVAGYLHGYPPAWEGISRVAPYLKNFVSAFPVTSSSNRLLPS